MTSRRSRPPNSPPPVRPSGSLDEERDQFLETFFRRGAQLTHELVRENERLRNDVARLEKDNAKLRLQVKSDAAMRDLVAKIEHLEVERTQLLTQFHEARDRSTECAGVYAELENELANLASLYVASRQLHTSTTVHACFRQLRELLEQLLGAQTYAVYFVSDDGTELVPIAWRGDEPVQHRVAVSQGPVGHTFVSGTSHVAEDDNLPHHTPSDPAACVPLRLGERVVGAIAIYSTFEQKTKFVPIDFELFKLLATHAAAAILSAQLLAAADGRMPSVSALQELAV